MTITRRFPTLFASLGLCWAALSCAPCLLAQSSTAHGLPKRLIGDYGYWSRTQTPPYSSAQIPFQELTHINHAGVNFNADGSLSVPDGFLEPELITKAHAAGVKVLLLLGGDFTGLETTAGGLSTLVTNLDTFIAEHHYDGVDIDWEYPSSALDETTFFNLMSALREAFPSPRYFLSADVAPWGGTGYDFPQVTPVVDFFNIMGYDCAGPWTDDGQLNFPIFPDPTNPEPWECEPGGSDKEAIDIYLQQLNVPPAKLNIGTPFYGYFYKNVSSLFGPCTNCNNTVLSENYGTFIKQRINAKGWETFYDTYALVPYMLRKDGKPGYITYDDMFSTYYRIWYSVWQRGLGGSFMWSLDADYDGTTQDLLTAMYSATITQPAAAPALPVP
jgi:chitinase